jgi:PIN domain nuclease of toxin-antitoxin system
VINLDTHILLDALDGRLRPSEEEVLGTNAWAIASIVLWEIGMLARDRRIVRRLDDAKLRRALERLTIWPIDLEVARVLGQLDFRSDPADELIAATSIRWDVPLLTRDMRILSSKVVPLALF